MMFDLTFIDTKYGKVLMNPIGNHIFIPNDDLINKLTKSAYELMIFGESIMEL